MYTPSFNPSQLEELYDALKKQDKFKVGQWFTQQSEGEITSLDEETYDEWVDLVEYWSFPNLDVEAAKVLAGEDVYAED